MACQYQSICSFFVRYGERKDRLWKGIFDFYCKGDFSRLCQNKQTFLADGQFPNTPGMQAGFPIPRVFFDIH